MSNGARNENEEVARECGLSLLEISEVYERGVVRTEAGPQTPAHVDTARPVIVDQWSHLDAELKRHGKRGVDDNDLWICATAIAHDLVLVTCDKRLSEISGLRSPIYLPPSPVPGSEVARGETP
jgi:predicted nucleic acid-binding protein